jgi:hypothetical protein
VITGHFSDVKNSFISADISNNTGIKNSVISVEKTRPYARETAAGIKYCACSEVSFSKGYKPAKVVIVVRNMALNRLVHALMLDCNLDISNSL